MRTQTRASIEPSCFLKSPSSHLPASPTNAASPNLDRGADSSRNQRHVLYSLGGPADLPATETVGTRVSTSANSQRTHAVYHRFALCATGDGTDRKSSRDNFFGAQVQPCTIQFAGIIFFCRLAVASIGGPPGSGTSDAATSNDADADDELGCIASVTLPVEPSFSIGNLYPYGRRHCLYRQLGSHIQRQPESFSAGGV